MSVVLLCVCALASLVIVLALVLLVGALRLKPTKVPAPLPAATIFGDDAAVQRFQAILRLPTVWGAEDAQANHKAFDAFIPTLQELWPRVFAELELTVVNDYGIMLRWAGAGAGAEVGAATGAGAGAGAKTDAGTATGVAAKTEAAAKTAAKTEHDAQTAAPVVFMAHYDVVEANPTGWTHKPFGAEIHNGRIYARGAVDTKCVLAALLEATSLLLERGYTPPRDVWICSSNCEEDMGDTAEHMVAYFKERGITPALVLDEGGAVIDNAPLGIQGEFAAIGVAEKGIFNARLTVEAAGGHAATPAPSDAPAALVQGLASMAAQPAPARLASPTQALLRELAARGSLGLRLVFGNLWLTRPLVVHIMKSNPETAAMVRTTYALTELAGSKAANVLPLTASATINVRVDPAETVNQAALRLKGHFLAGTTLEVANATEPSPVSAHDGAAFAYLRAVCASVYPTAGIAPYIQSSASDARHFSRICPHTYRFAGFLFKGEQRSRIHGQDENLDVESYKRGVGFYVQLIEHLNRLDSQDDRAG